MRRNLIGIRTMGLVLAGLTFLGAGVGFAQKKAEGNAKFGQTLNSEVHHQLVMLPRFSVFDNLEYAVKGNEVTLTGQVRNSAIKRDAENAVKSIEGVTVRNNIEILPASPNDDRIRVAVYRAIYGDTVLQRYALGAVQPIHIIVKNGHVTLAGFVANKGDSDLANIRANGVAGVFSVTNKLRLDTET